MKSFFLLLLLELSLFAKEATLDFGIGLGTILFPDYMGSKSTQSYTLPFPYVIYKSDYLDIDKDGISTTLFDIKDLVLDLSFSGSLPANSEHTKLREDMPNLDLTFEFGPRITYKFFEHGLAHLYFELPIRAVFSTDFQTLGTQGFVTTPQIKYSLEYKHFEFVYRIGALYGDEKYHDYFYEVQKEYETSWRKAYNAKAGYGGFKNKVSLSYTKNNYFAGMSVSYYNLHSAVYENSPLIETKNAFYFGASVAYILFTTN